jgi:hypothetical protein
MACVWRFSRWSRSCIARLRNSSGADPIALAIAIEVPRGAIVETLTEHGFAVFSINPKQLDRFRRRDR